MKKGIFFINSFLILSLCSGCSNDIQKNEFDVIFNNYDGTLLLSTKVVSGQDAIYTGSIPTKENDNGYSYVFSGWDKSLKNILQDTIFTAQYDSSAIKFTITWKNGDTILETDNNVSYGVIPTYDGTTPTKKDDVHNLYVFSGRSPEINPVTDNQTYVAQFNAYSKFIKYKFNEETNEYYVSTCYEDTIGEVDISAFYDNGTNGIHKVTSIGSKAFYNCSRLTLINIPESIVSIGYSAFYNCSSLTSIIIPNGVKSIEYNVFCDCFSLTSIKIPDGVTSIGKSAFSRCSSLVSLIIPKGVVLIDEMVFYGCINLTSVNIPDGVKSIGKSAFSHCPKLASVNISDGVTSIGEGAFLSCSSLTSIKIPDGVTSIKNNVFSYCFGLTSINIPDGVTSIGDYAFDYCRALTSINIPDCVTSIGKYAFEGCSLLNIYYKGSSIPVEWSDKRNCENRPLYFYSETQPIVAGNYWHYVDGNPTIWEN